LANKTKFDFWIDKNLGDQSYYISINQQKEILITGGDTTGLMYACLELAEQIRLNKKTPSGFPINGEPYIQKRGLKFNIPLDIRSVLV
jgi:hypothetical protein